VLGGFVVKPVLELTAPVVDCVTFNRFVEDVYGNSYSSQDQLDEYEFCGNGSYTTIDVEQWEKDNPLEDGEYENYYGCTFDEWLGKEKTSWGHNPRIEIMVRQLVNDGYDVPLNFTLLVWW
jgi:hypothetical protein